MITQQEIMTKINELIAYCEANGEPTGTYAAFISVLNSPINNYFNTTSDELSDNVRDLIPKIYNDKLLRCTTYERPIGKPLPTDYPKGYMDLTVIFDGGGAFSEIMAISPATFLDGFPVETASDEGGSSIIVLQNPIIEEWQSKVNNAHNTEIKGIETVMEFCERGGFGQALIYLFEDMGKMTKTKGKQDLAREIYVDMGVKEVIETFNLDIHVPTYL